MSPVFLRDLSTPWMNLKYLELELEESLHLHLSKEVEMFTLKERPQLLFQSKKMKKKKKTTTMSLLQPRLFLVYGSYPSRVGKFGDDLICSEDVKTLLTLFYLTPNYHWLKDVLIEEWNYFSKVLFERKVLHTSFLNEKISRKKIYSTCTATSMALMLQLWLQVKKRQFKDEDKDDWTGRDEEYKACIIESSLLFQDEVIVVVNLVSSGSFMVSASERKTDIHSSEDVAMHSIFPQDISSLRVTVTKKIFFFVGEEEEVALIMTTG